MIDFNRITRGLLNKERVLVMAVLRIVEGEHIFTYHTINFKGGKPVEIVKCFGMECGFELHLCVN